MVFVFMLFMVHLHMTAVRMMLFLLVMLFDLAAMFVLGIGFHLGMLFELGGFLGVTVSVTDAATIFLAR